MGRWWQVVGVEGKKEGGELSLKKVCANSFELYSPTNITIGLTWTNAKWGGPPGPQPTPTSACRVLDEADFVSNVRVILSEKETKSTAWIASGIAD
jgi:hypothetical protein